MPRFPLRAAAALTAVLLAGCGSEDVAELPPAAGPARSPAAATTPVGVVTGALGELTQPARVDVGDGSQQAEVLGRARELVLRDTATGRILQRADAGVGPAAVFARGPFVWVTDTPGDALLIYRRRPKLELVRRLTLPGGPYAIVFDKPRFRLWVTLTERNEVAELPAHGRPRVLRTFPTIRQPDRLAIDPDGGEVVVQGGGREQRFTPPPSPDDV